MRKLWLVRDDHDLFQQEISPQEYLYFVNHVDTFKRMWAEQGKEFWTMFVQSFKDYNRNFGSVKDLLEKRCDSIQLEELETAIDETFIFIFTEYVTGKASMAKNLIMDCAVIAKNQHMLMNIERPSHSSNPFLLKTTRDVFRRLFGPPHERGTHIKVLCGFPIFLRFAGSVVILLKRWLVADEVDTGDKGAVVAYYMAVRERMQTTIHNKDSKFKIKECYRRLPTKSCESAPKEPAPKQKSKSSTSSKQMRFGTTTKPSKESDVAKSDTEAKNIATASGDLNDVSETAVTKDIKGDVATASPSYLNEAYDTIDSGVTQQELTADVASANCKPTTSSANTQNEHTGKVLLKEHDGKASSTDDTSSCNTPLNGDNKNSSVHNGDGGGNAVSNVGTESKATADAGSLLYDEYEDDDTLGDDLYSNDLYGSDGDCFSSKADEDERGLDTEAFVNSVAKLLKLKLHRCANCGSIEMQPKSYRRCHKCKGRSQPSYYCCKDCQVADWRSRHRLDHRCD